VILFCCQQPALAPTARLQRKRAASRHSVYSVLNAFVSFEPHPGYIPRCFLNRAFPPDAMKLP